MYIIQTVAQNVFCFVQIFLLKNFVLIQAFCFNIMVEKNMKKMNKFRSGTSNAFSLNYKFDSVSLAGKCNGTALDLIKRYNDLAKEAHSAGNFVEMEIFRQYAEHYRKIVTEINERRGYKPENTQQAESAEGENNEKPSASVQTVSSAPEQTSVKEEPVKKTFTVIELSPNTEEAVVAAPKPKRTVRRKTASQEAAV